MANIRQFDNSTIRQFDNSTQDSSDSKNMVMNKLNNYWATQKNLLQHNTSGKITVELRLASIQEELASVVKLDTY
jgi:1,2-phenylacetyl-CoA epoxidase catalytic subunit